MPSHTALPVDSHSLPPPSSGGWWAVCLWAAGWCGTCRDYRALFDALAQAHPRGALEWVDMKTNRNWRATWMAETFPTLLIADGRKAHFLTPLLPQAAVLERLLTTLRSGAPSGAATDPMAQEVFDRVHADRTVAGGDAMNDSCWRLFISARGQFDL